MNKYIIKNCEQIIGDNFCCSKNALCSDCTDCKLKQIVEKCQGEINGDWYKSNAYYAMGRVAVAEQILLMLDIQEVK
jgi:hypothetical protein